MKVRILSKNASRVVDLNRRKAIRERYLNCSAWIPSEVSHCTYADYQLYAFRSGRGKQDAKTRKQAIRAYCLRCIAGQDSEVAKCTTRTCPLFAFRLREVDHNAEIDPEAKSVHGDSVGC